MIEWTYDVVDVFTETPLEGNALAVFPDARRLDDRTMQRIARELNLSETTFVFPPSLPGAAALVRIFTPLRELPFAGHPTIGTAFVLRARGLVEDGRDAFVLEEGVGPVPVRVDRAASMLWLQTPPIAFEEIVPPEAAVAAVGLTAGDIVPGVPCAIVSAGNPFLYVAVESVAAVDRAALDLAAYERLGAEPGAPASVFVFAATPSGAYARMFAPALGILEDPATGSGTGPLAAFMMRFGLAPSRDGTLFVSEQGTKMGRRSLLHVLIHGEAGAQSIEVGGHVTPIATALLSLPSDSSR